MARGGDRGPTSAALLLAVLLATPALPTALAGIVEDPTAESDADEAWPEATLDAYEWSTQHSDTLVSPLVTATANRGWTPKVLDAYGEGQAWAETTLAAADRAVLADGLLQLVHIAQRHDDMLDERLRGVDVAREDLRTGDVPEPFVAPLAALVQLQLLPRDNPVTEDAWAHAETRATETAFTLGALEVLRDALHGAADHSRLDDVTPLDPLGLVILGSHHDDTYTPTTLVANATWQGPILLVEPGGDDTYHIPIAARAIVTFGSLPTGYDKAWVDVGSYGIDLDGHDTYTHNVATSMMNDQSGQILLEENGDDRYGTLDNSHSLGYANPGLAMLHDKQGNDTYKLHDQGLAHAWIFQYVSHYSAIALVADKHGNDTYAAHEGLTSGRTHAYADNGGAIALLRDYDGQDRYVANILSYATVDDDGNALFWEDSGDDDYHLDLRGSSFGTKFISEGGVIFAPAKRSFGYFLDGSGHDEYTWSRICGLCSPGKVPENNLSHVDTREERKWGIFVDCETPENRPVPCPNRQVEVLEQIAKGET